MGGMLLGTLGLGLWLGRPGRDLIYVSIFNGNSYCELTL
jgi:hypothetical protein